MATSSGRWECSKMYKMSWALSIVLYSSGIQFGELDQSSKFGDICKFGDLSDLSFSLLGSEWVLMKFPANGDATKV